VKPLQSFSAFIIVGAALFLSTVADAAKENFDRSKPHLTISVSIDGNNDNSVRISGLSGLGVETPSDDERRKRPGRTKYSNITLKRAYTGSTDLQEWATKATTEGDECRDCTKNIKISMLKRSGEVVRTFNILDAFPVKWEISTADQARSNVAVETIVVKMQRVELQ